VHDRTGKNPWRGDDGRATVAVASCTDYTTERVDGAVRQVVRLLGGLDRFVTPGTRVLLKPNLLQGLPPERSVSTHPAVVGAMARLLLAHGCTVTLADSPGGGIRYTGPNLKRAYQEAGYEALARENGFTLNLDTGSEVVPYPGGNVCTRFPLIAPARASDHIVVVSKAKTHVLTLLTGGTKNLFGLIPGLEKPLFHSRFQEPRRFAGMLVDLNLMLQPSLQVVDAVVAMEGDGPTGGSPRSLGVILAGADPLAVDMVLCRLMSLDPLDVPILAYAVSAGLCRCDGRDIDLLGDPLEPFVLHDFRKPSTYQGPGRGMRVKPLFRAVHRLGRVYALRPSVVPGSCTGCGRCATICPGRAITLQGRRARIDLSRCIRCYCCHEMCSGGAIRLGRGPAGSLLHRILRWEASDRDDGAGQDGAAR